MIRQEGGGLMGWNGRAGRDVREKRSKQREKEMAVHGQKWEERKKRVISGLPQFIPSPGFPRYSLTNTKRMHE